MMEEQPTPVNNMHITGHNKTSNKAKVILSLLLLLALAGAGTAGYFWYQEKARTDDLNRQVTTLQGQLAAKPPTENIPATSGKTSYKATTGKFTLTLPQNYVIALNADGAVEGGRATSLTIGTRSPADNNIVMDNPYQRVTINAIVNPGANITTYQQWTQGLLNVPANDQRKLPAITIDGQAAEVYEVAHLDTVRFVFFQKDDIWYSIQVEGAQANSEPVKVLDEVIKGFKFN